MRTFKEIKADLNHATSINDAEALRTLASEAQEQGSKEAEGFALNALGSVARLSGDIQAALEYHRRALAMFEQMGHSEGVSVANGNLGIVHYSIGDYPKALEYYGGALAMYEELGDRAGVAAVTGNMGVVYRMTGDYPSALEHYRRALEMHEEMGRGTGVADVTANMGVVYLNTGDYSQALEHFKRALTLHEDLGNRVGVAKVTGNMGNVYAETGDHTQAFDHYRRARALHEEQGDSAYVSLATGNMVAALFQADKYDEAAELLASQSAMPMDNPVVRALHSADQAKLAERHGDLNAARAFLLEALTIADKTGLRAQSAVFHEKLRDLAQKRNDFEGYIQHNNEHQRITEEIRGKDATQRMAMLEAERKMEAERREREKERALLYGALPEHIATRMLRGESVEDHFENAAVLFADIVGFTTHTSTMHPSETINLLEELYKDFDAICAEHDTTKVKTIGDSYLCFSESAENVAAVAVKMLAPGHTWPDGSPLQLRIGIHAGPLSAGVIGTQRLQYDIWGDTVNVASRMESTGEAGRVQVSAAFAEALSTGGGGESALEKRGEVEIKGKGTMTTYWLE